MISYPYNIVGSKYVSSGSFPSSIKYAYACAPFRSSFSGVTLEKQKRL